MNFWSKRQLKILYHITILTFLLILFWVFQIFREVSQYLDIKDTNGNKIILCQTTLIRHKFFYLFFELQESLHLLSFPFLPSTFRKIVCQVHHHARRHGITSVLCSINLMYNQRQEQRQRIDKNVWSFVCKMQSASKYYSHSSSKI